MVTELEREKYDLAVKLLTGLYAQLRSGRVFRDVNRVRLNNVTEITDAILDGRWTVIKDGGTPDRLDEPVSSFDGGLLPA